MNLSINNSVNVISFEEIYLKYWDKILNNVCMKYTKDRNKAEDYCQIGFIKVYDNLHKYADKGTLEGWIGRIVRNAIIDEIRKEKNIFSYDFNYIDIETTDEEYEELYNVDMIYSVLDKLPPSYRIAFDMYYMEGLKHEEISKKLNISLSASKTNLMKAKNKIRKILNV